MEQIQSQEDIRIRLGNEMQIQLALQSGESIEEFIERHAEDFRKVVNEHPELFDEYQTKPEETLSKMKANIYH